MQFLYRIGIEPAPATKQVRVPAVVQVDGYEVGFAGALVLRRHLVSPADRFRAIDGAEAVVQRFLQLLAAQTGLPATAGTRTLRLGHGQGQQIPARMPPPVFPGDEPWRREVAWALAHLPLLASPLVQEAVALYLGALHAEAPTQEAAAFHRFGLLLADGLRGQEADFPNLLGLHDLAFRRWLGALDRARRGAQPDGAGLRGRLVAGQLLERMAGWAPRLQTPLAVAMD